MNIIIVDDEPLANSNLCRRISEVCPTANLKQFGSSLEALNYVNAHYIDIAFLDINMPELDGIHLAKRIKAARKNVHIVFVTAYDSYALEAIKSRAGGYVLKPASTEDIKAEIEYAYQINPFLGKTDVRVQCFGGFDVFVKNAGKIHFTRSKSKELLAYLVDKRGNDVNNAEMAAVLFEERKYDHSLKAYLRKITSDMIKILKNYDAQKIVVKMHNSMAVDTTAFECDYYNFIDGDAHAINAYHENYMSGYSWAEETNASITMRTKRID